MEENKVLLSVKDLVVKFRVRGRVLTAIRNISLDIYENESIAIVGESGSGKSVFTKTFAGMLDTNGFIDQGNIIFDDETLADTVVALDGQAKSAVASAEKQLNAASPLELGAETWREMEALKREKEARETLSEEELQQMEEEIGDLIFRRTELFNQKQTFDPAKEKKQIREASAKIAALDQEIREKQKNRQERIRQRKREAEADHAYLKAYQEKEQALQARYREQISRPVSEETKERNRILAREIELSVGRYGPVKRRRTASQLVKALREAMREGRDLSDEDVRNAVFDPVTFRVRYLDENEERLHGTCILNLAKIKDPTDWTKIRGTRIATVFQDPMTSLNPIITIGKQITSIILKHQNALRWRPAGGRWS
jgi:ABC-type dipeptide/oligopeptide/nickel transport system, ATPase component